MPTWTDWNKNPVEYQDCRKSSVARWEHERKEALRLHHIAEVKPRVDSKRLPTLPQSRSSSRPSTRASTAASTSSRSSSSTPIRYSNKEQWRIFETSILGPRSRESFALPSERSTEGDALALTSKTVFDCTQKPAFFDRTRNPRSTQIVLPPLQSQQRSSRRKRVQSEDGSASDEHHCLNMTAKTLLCVSSPCESSRAEQLATTVNLSATLNGTPANAEQTFSASDAEEYEHDFDDYAEEESSCCSRSSSAPRIDVTQ